GAARRGPAVVGRARRRQDAVGFRSAPPHLAGLTQKARTRRFAVAVLDFVDTLPRTASGDAIARQLARAGLGIAGNYRASCRGRSHTEFTARLGVVLESERARKALTFCHHTFPPAILQSLPPAIAMIAPCLATQR